VSDEDVPSPQVANIHRNLSQTATMVKNLQTMSDKVSHLDALLTSDQSHPLGPCGPSANLLPIHYQLQQLEAFRNEALHQAKKSAGKGEQGQEDRRTLVGWFERLDDLGNRFEEWLWAIAANILETAREGNGGAIVRLLKIIEVEGKEDQKVSC
jgi:exocyst complex component 3